MGDGKVFLGYSADEGAGCTGPGWRDGQNCAPTFAMLFLLSFQVSNRIHSDIVRSCFFPFRIESGRIRIPAGTHQKFHARNVCENITAGMALFGLYFLKEAGGRYLQHRLIAAWVATNTWSSSIFFRDHGRSFSSIFCGVFRTCAGLAFPSAMGGPLAFSDRVAQYFLIQAIAIVAIFNATEQLSFRLRHVLLSVELRKSKSQESSLALLAMTEPRARVGDFT